MKKILLFLFLINAFCAVAQKPKLYVLAIGVKDYKDNDLDLHYADKDAQEIAALFQKQSNLYDVRLVKILTNENATRQAIREAFLTFQERVGPDDFFIFFFSGHGMENSLVPYDFNYDDPDGTVLSQTLMMNALDKMGCNSLILLDACHSGSFAKGIGKDVGIDQRQLNTDEAIRRLVEGFKAYDKMRLILGSSASNKSSYECDECQNGFFAQGLIDAFNNVEFKDADGYTVKPDANQNGYLSPSEFSTYLQDAVKNRTAKARSSNPRIEIQKVYKKEQTTTDAPFIFVGGSKIPPPPPPINNDRDGDGIPNNQDKCPDNYGTAARGGCPDDDGGSDDYDNDGFADNIDTCPTEKGTANGCPDSDNDGVPDKSDKCKNEYGKPEFEGCPDSDNDGIPNYKDNCPNEKGTKTYNGCPPPAPTTTDSDNDGVPDKEDKCPTEKGTANGCPDADRDGVPDKEDKCPTEAGIAANNGCPNQPYNSDFEEDLSAGIKVKMVFVPGGTFMMGSEEYSDEKPVHQVTLSDFYIGKTEVTQKQWRKIMGSNPSYFKNCDECPVEGVSWNDVQEFLQKLNSKTGKNYRLPTEAEWEYAARGGNKSRGYTYAGSNNIGEVAWYDDNCNIKPQPIGLKKANELGIFDMTGNVWEWCSDRYGAYSSGSQTNPTGASSGKYRVLRGGSWDLTANDCRVANRFWMYLPTDRYSVIGFRVCLGY